LGSAQPDYARVCSAAIERFEVIVIGGGQAGLAAGYHLAKLRAHFVILDDGQRTGDPWRRRWDSLRLFTPARINGLPGARFPAPPRAIVTKDQVADYMESYVKRFALPLRHGVRVKTLTREGDTFEISADGQSWQANQVVVATGSYGTPRQPEFAAQLDPSITRLHSTEYRNPAQLASGDVLVVGAGNSGAEIAMDAAASGHRTWLAGRNTGQIPYRIAFLPPAYWLFTRVMSTDTPVGRRVAPLALSRGQPLVRIKSKDLAAAGIERVPRVVGVQEGKPRLEDGRVLDVGTVVWSTGFDHSYPWIKLPIAGESGHVQHTRGVVESQPGLYFVGIPFQHRISSSLIDGVGEDAKYVVEKIAARRSRA
jgi:putative flavoprotein involved in K+ transport